MYCDLNILEGIGTYNSWNTKFWFKYPIELIWYYVILYYGFWPNEHVFSCFTMLVTVSKGST